MTGLYNADGQRQVTIVNGASYTGPYAIDGTYNGVTNDGITAYKGTYHPCGAYNVCIVTNLSAGAYAPNGSLNVIASSNGYALLGRATTYATWDPVTKGSTAVLSNNNLTLTNPSGSVDNNVTALSTSAKTIGKFVVRIIVVNANAANIGIGLGKPPIPATGFAADTNSCGAYNDSIYNNSFTLLGNTGGAWVNGDSIYLAANLNTSLFWVRRNALLWNNNAAGNPETGVGGFAFSSGMTAGSSLYLMAWCSGANFSLTLDPNPSGSGLTTFLGWI